MTVHYDIRCKIQQGRVPEAVRERIRQTLGMLNGDVAHIVIEKAKKKRSLNQNAFYHGVVTPCVAGVLEHYGNDADNEVAHEICKRDFLPREGRRLVTLPSGETIEARSTTWLTTKSWEEYIERIRAWCAAEGVEVPYPNEDTIQ